MQPKGTEALKNVAKVLEQNADINVLIEGHTDDVPMVGKGEIKDNWDLSVIRATSVTKIILHSKPIGYLPPKPPNEFGFAFVDKNVVLAFA